MKDHQIVHFRGSSSIFEEGNRAVWFW